jgi:hypothetical protein
VSVTGAGSEWLQREIAAAGGVRDRRPLEEWTDAELDLEVEATRRKLSLARWGGRGAGAVGTVGALFAAKRLIGL